MNHTPMYETDELYHYGVKGMRWGVRRATNRLSSATTKEQRDKAISSLKKHKEKSTAKIAKLEKRRPKLEKSVERKIVENDTAAAKLRQKAAYTRDKAYGIFTTKSRAEKRLYKANKLDAQAGRLMADSQKAKAALAKNEALTKAFKQGIKDIDQALVDKGRRYING